MPEAATCLDPLPPGYEQVKYELHFGKTSFRSPGPRAYEQTHTQQVATVLASEECKGETSEPTEIQDTQQLASSESIPET